MYGSSRHGRFPVRFSLGGFDAIRPAHQTPINALIEQSARISLIGLFVVAAFTAAIYGRLILVPIVTALLIGLTLGPLADRLERRGTPSYLASALVLTGLLLVLCLILYVIALPAQEWFNRIPEVWERLRERAHLLRAPLAALNRLGEEVSAGVDDATDAGSPPIEIVENENVALSAIVLVPPVIGQIVVFTGTLFFFLANRSRLRLAMLSLCVNRRTRLRSARIFRDTESFLSRYVATVAAINLGLGLATFAATAALGLPAPALWGALAFFFNFIPYLGPFMVTVILVGVGMVSFQDLLPALAPAGAFLALNIVESQLVTPLLVGRRLTLNPFMVFVALAVWIWLWGPVGGLIAVPLLVVGTVTLNHVVPRYQRPEVSAPAPRKSPAEARSAAGKKKQRPAA